jgi:phosphatidylserine/phosphatidylglycerophosphate/cardiolipin synthase-like enzyme
VSDDRALVGTLNLDAWAMFRNPEHGMLFDDRTIADRVSSTLVEPGIAASVRGEATRDPLLRFRNRVLAKASYLF